MILSLFGSTVYNSCWVRIVSSYFFFPFPFNEQIFYNVKRLTMRKVRNRNDKNGNWWALKIPTTALDTCYMQPIFIGSHWSFPIFFCPCLSNTQYYSKKLSFRNKFYCRSQFKICISILFDQQQMKCVFCDFGKTKEQGKERKMKTFNNRMNWKDSEIQAQRSFQRLSKFSSCLFYPSLA